MGIDIMEGWEGIDKECYTTPMESGILASTDEAEKKGKSPCQTTILEMTRGCRSFYE